jgi:hypothetical protein
MYIVQYIQVTVTKKHIKGIVLRDFAHMFLVPIDRFEVPTPYGAVRLLLNFVFVSKFSIFPSQRSELTLSIVRGSKSRHFPLVLHRKLMRAPEAAKSPGLGQFLSPKFFRQKTFA